MLKQDEAEKILREYESSIGPLTGLDSYLTRELVSRLSIVLTAHNYGIASVDYSSLKPREVPTHFQLTHEELKALEFPNPFEIYTRPELCTLYGNIGARVYNCAMTASRGEQTLLEVKRTMIEYRQNVRSGQRSPFRNLGKKTALAMEDYLIFKSQEQKSRLRPNSEQI